MAKYLPGPTVAAVSGSIGGTTYSRNRYGVYMRDRVMPVNPATVYQLNQRARISAQSQAWAGLTDNQRTAWIEWAKSNTVIDRLGKAQVLTGHTAFVMLNSRIQVAGGTAIEVPPTVNAPDALTALSHTADIGAGDFEYNFLPAPIGAGLKLEAYAAIAGSAGVRYAKNLMKQVAVSAAAQATGWDTQTDMETRFGSLGVGALILHEVRVIDPVTGLVSPPMSCVSEVVST